MTPGTLAVGLSAWVIQDGNYGDLATRQHVAFALEFCAREPLVVIDADASSLEHIANSRYAVVGKVVHADEDWWVLDVGILVYWEKRPPTIAVVGTWLRGEISIGVDPYFYFFSLANRESAPAMIYDW